MLTREARMGNKTPEKHRTGKMNALHDLRLELLSISSPTLRWRIQKRGSEERVSLSRGGRVGNQAG